MSGLSTVDSFVVFGRDGQCEKNEQSSSPIIVLLFVGECVVSVSSGWDLADTCSEQYPTIAETSRQFRDSDICLRMNPRSYSFDIDKER